MLKNSLKEVVKWVTEGRVSRVFCSWFWDIFLLIPMNVQFPYAQVQDVPVMFGRFTLSSAASGGYAASG